MSDAVIMRRRAFAAAIAVAISALLWILLLGGGSDGDPEPRPAVRNASEQVRGLLGSLSTEEKVDQLLVAGFEGTSAGNALLEQLTRRSPGAVFINFDNWPQGEAGRELTRQLRSATRGRIDSLIATRQEGGTYRSLPDVPPEQREVTIGDRGDVGRAQRWGQELGEGLAEAGFDLNLGPVADIASLDSPIGDRAFSDDPEIVAAMTAAAVLGCRQGGIVCAPSHFPGMGAASQSTTQGPATVGLDGDGLRTRELAPFRAAIDQGALALTVSHAFYAAYDPVTPASLSPEILGGLLRDELDFDGVAITDDLMAGAIRAGRTVPEAAVEALAAGADMVTITGPREAEAARQAMLGAVEADAIPIERLDEAVARILSLKQDAGAI